MTDKSYKVLVSSVVPQRSTGATGLQGNTGCQGLIGSHGTTEYQGLIGSQGTTGFSIVNLQSVKGFIGVPSSWVSSWGSSDATGLQSSSSPTVQTYDCLMCRRPNQFDRIIKVYTNTLDKCVICLDAESNMCFTQCGHICCCQSCIEEIKK